MCQSFQQEFYQLGGERGHPALAELLGDTIMRYGFANQGIGPPTRTDKS